MGVNLSSSEDRTHVVMLPSERDAPDSTGLNLSSSEDRTHVVMLLSEWDAVDSSVGPPTSGATDSSLQLRSRKVLVEDSRFPSVASLLDELEVEVELCSSNS